MPSFDINPKARRLRLALSLLKLPGMFHDNLDIIDTTSSIQESAKAVLIHKLAYPTYSKYTAPAEIRLRKAKTSIIARPNRAAPNARS